MRNVEYKMVRDPQTGSDAQSPPDHVLVDRCRNGDLGAFDVLVERYQRRVYGYACRMLGDPETAREVTQDIFMRTYRYVGKFRGDSKFSTWLFTIVSSTCKNAMSYHGLRARHRAEHSFENVIDGERTSLLDRLPDNRQAPEELARQRDVQRMVRDAIDTLPEHYKQVIILRDMNDFKYDEISKILGCRVGTVKSRLARARLLVREELTRAGLLGNEG